MGNPLAVVFGIFLIGVAFFILAGNQYNLFQSTDTGIGSQWENNTQSVKNTVNLTQDLIIYSPIILLIVGLLLVAGGKLD